MRKTKNITVAVSQTKYREARIFAASRNVSLSSIVEFFFDNLPLLSKAVRSLLVENPNFGSAPAGFERARPGDPLGRRAAQRQ